MPGFLTRGVLIGDVRITLHDRTGSTPDREVEGVQKIHAIAPNIAMGFAGNVDTGMLMVGDMARSVRLSIPEGTMLTQPSRHLLHWRRRARWAWQNRLSDRDRAGGCALLWIGALPPNGPFGPTVGWILRAPEFQLERIPSRTAQAIGSGEHVPEYAAELEALAEDVPSLFQFEVQGFDAVGGPAVAITTVITEALDQHRVPGISPHLVICTVRWGEVGFATNDRVMYRADEEPEVRAMPPIARTWDEWQAFKEEHGLADLLAVG